MTAIIYFILIFAVTGSISWIASNYSGKSIAVQAIALLVMFLCIGVMVLSPFIVGWLL